MMRATDAVPAVAVKTPILDYFARHSEMSAPGRHVELFKSLPADVLTLARTVQGLVMHEFVAESF